VKYWQRNGMTETMMLWHAEDEYLALEAKGSAFDRMEMEAMRKVGGNDYVYLSSLVFRQTIAAQKLVSDEDGTPCCFLKRTTRMVVSIR
jgi:hypothetical protein